MNREGRYQPFTILSDVTLWCCMDCGAVVHPEYVAVHDGMIHGEVAEMIAVIQAAQAHEEALKVEMDELADAELMQPMVDPDGTE